MMPAAQSDSLWSNPLIRHLAVVMAAKLLLLTVLWWLFFRMPADQGLSAEDINTHIAGPSAGNSYNATR